MKTKIIIILTSFSIISCQSNREMSYERMQEEVYKISEEFFTSQIGSINKDTLWINSFSENESGIGLFETNPNLHFGKMPIESHIKDSIFKDEILTKENIAFFKKQFQLKENGYELISKKLSENPNIGLVPKEAGLRFRHGKDLRYISSIMFTKNGEYVLFYVSTPNGTIALWVYKKWGKKWKYFKAFHVGYS